MAAGNPPAEEGSASSTGEKAQDTAASPAEQRIQFVPAARPPRVSRPIGGDGLAIRARTPSIPRVVTEEEKSRRKREEEEEKKHVNIDEHLLPPEDVALRYKTRINIEKPADSLGLTTQQAAELLQEHGANVLTPPKKRHPFLKYLDYLFSLFNLLLIVAGILEYILLGINFDANFANVSRRFRHPRRIRSRY